jgi:hypothetical protein
MFSVRPPLPWLLLFVFGLAVGANSASPLAALEGQPLRSISLGDNNGHSVVLTRPEDLAFVTSHLVGLPTHSEGKVNSEFELVFTPVQGVPLRLRLDRRCIGPNVPSSDVVTRWYFPDRVLYDFVASRLNATS